MVENSFRTTLAQIIGGSLLLLSLYLTYRNVKVAQENSRIANENLRVTEEGKLTDRFSKAVELLGDKKLEIRLGGVYALERIAHDSQKDHWTVMEVLTAFVRENSHRKLDAAVSEEKGEKEKNYKPREDIQAIITVIGRRKWTETEYPRILDLSGVILTKCTLYKISLRRANLKDADLRRASLSKADLSKADLRGAVLYGANLEEANLYEADLYEADLAEANLNRANLREANLKEADLRETKYLRPRRLSSARNHEEAILSSELKQKLEEYLAREPKEETKDSEGDL